MKARYCSPLLLCIIALSIPIPSHGQETEDTRAIRSMFDADQTAWNNADGQGVLSNRHEHYFTARVPRNNGRPDFYGVIMGDSRKDQEAGVNDPEKAAQWKARVAATKSDTVLDAQWRAELVRIDVRENYAVALSRHEWARNDTIKKVRVRGGWESLWFLRKIDGDWKFVNALGGISSWTEE